MEKDFDNWNELKKKINSRNPIYVSERDIWFCSVGLNIGSEQSRRLARKIGVISVEEFQIIKDRLKDYI